MKLVISGVSGLLGGLAVRFFLNQGYSCLPLLRPTSKFPLFPASPGLLSPFMWTGQEPFPEEAWPVPPFALIHLAGAPVGPGRWTKTRRTEILDSRIVSTRLLRESLLRLPPSRRPSCVLCASAIGLYGNQGNTLLTEESPLRGSDFLSQVVQAWEQEMSFPSRTVILRLGLVLSSQGGILPRLPPLWIGEGTQWISWIGAQDVLRFLLWALTQPKASGPFHLTTPHPIRQRDWAWALARWKRWPLPLWAPPFVFKQLLGEAANLLLFSQRCLPQRALAEGFQFKTPHLTSWDLLS